MLVLTRKVNEEIIIAGSIRVKILEINGSRIRLGISAPDHVSVVREEILARLSGTVMPDRELELVGAAE